MTAFAGAIATAEDFDLAHPWHRAIAARDILAVDPLRLGGLLLRARHGPARSRWLDGLPEHLSPWKIRRLHPRTPDDVLYGMVDLTRSLAMGRTVSNAGILSEPAQALLIPATETAEAGFAARLSHWLDARSGMVIALDEAADDEEGAPGALSERLAMHVCLDGLTLSDCVFGGAPPAQIAMARGLLPEMTGPEAIAEELVGLAAALGIDSLRAPILAAQVACAAAALAGRLAPGAAEIALATALVLAPRARRLPQPPEAARDAEDHTSDRPDPQEVPDDAARPEAPGPEDEIDIGAALALLPPDLLAQIATRIPAGKAGGRQARAGCKTARGAFAASRPGRIGNGARVDLIATLRRAAPWQGVRRRDRPDSPAVVQIRPEDIAVAQRRGRAERLAIFAVDASGSTAMGRLAECKGAVELLLSEAYRNRDQVAMIAFRGRSAEVLLPPTRSIVQTRRRLSTLPGGGPTPLASGLEKGLRLAEATRRRGMSPSLIVMTDGRGNIALDGSADRAAAQADLDAIALAIRHLALPALVIDIARMPRPAASSLADRMGARYLPLPCANARSLSEAVRRQWDA